MEIAIYENTETDRQNADIKMIEDKTCHEEYR